MIEIRCVKCKRLLMKVEMKKNEGNDYIWHIKCSKCHYINDIQTKYIGKTKLFTKPKGEIIEIDGGKSLRCVSIL